MGTVLTMPVERPKRSYKVVVQFERRADGGLRAWCDDVPGFALSHRDADAVLADVQPALEIILSAQLGEPFVTTPLGDIRADLERSGVIGSVRARDAVPDHVEYAALSA